MADVGTKSVQFDLGYQTELPHSYQAGYGRGSTEIIEGPLYIFVLLMDKLVELQVAAVSRQSVVVAHASALAQDSMAESVQGHAPNLLEYPPIRLWNRHRISPS